VACESVIADEKITGKSRAAAFWFRGDTLNKKRDYDGAIAAYSAAHDADPDNVSYINSRGIAHSNKGDDEHAARRLRSVPADAPEFCERLQ
jgi:tetratricopeptide (TPR) repeat protein